MRRRLVLISAALVCSVIALLREAQAFCILQLQHGFLPGPFAEFQAIPVYVDENFHLIGVGGNQSLAEEIEAIKLALDIINSAGADAPRLFFGGVIEAPPFGSNLFSVFAPEVDATGGIVISGYNPGSLSCSNESNGFLAETSADTFKVARTYVRRGAPFTCDGLSALQWYVDPNDDIGSPGDNDVTKDLVGVLAHEILHALGLGHNNEVGDEEVCFTDNGMIPAFTAVNSLMNTQSSGRLWRRRLKRDDVEGLRFLYGAPERRAFFSESSFSPPSPMQWVNPIELQAGLRVNTPVSLTNAAFLTDNRQLAGFTNAADEVRFLESTFTSWAANPAGGTAIVEGSPVQTWERVVVARGNTLLGLPRELVAWLAGPAQALNQDEDIQNLDGRVRFRVRREGAWLPPALANTVTKYRSFGAGYDPLRDVFVLAYIDVCDPDPTLSFCENTADLPKNSMVFVRTISVATGATSCTQALSTVGRVQAVGDVSCDFRALGQDTQCKIPIATTDATGPRLRIIEGTIGNTPSPNCFLRAVAPEPPLTLNLRAYGSPSSAMNALVPNGPMLGAHTPGFSGGPAAAGYAAIFTMDRTPQGALDGGVDNATTFQTWFWPLHVGSVNRTPQNPGIKWRVITY